MEILANIVWGIVLLFEPGAWNEFFAFKFFELIGKLFKK